ncbi:peroxisomal biogenesis aaa ATPase Pex1 [Naegleria gruberi]|uniref:Peroxisomal biogenesis aaa ATPase Pex1 n=1 Tax=Naegleria gruberi TaxID=5762 RepID=D2UZ61_NAEGR|nr:Peroxin 1 (Pex1), putative [Naegleria gruberi]EFC49887.1 peroxisomal biogenesis aaa ATPase Pex1 [Naegleria gruberi]|eukprot:XP_002682631.1 peroxisomal biogenesis aaa ATPase Pex1 [Naegleria gruberi strain NEG-M]
MPTIFVGKHLIWMLGAVEHSTVYLKYIEEPLYPNFVHSIYVRPILDMLPKDIEVSMDNYQELTKIFREWILERKTNSLLTVPSIAMAQRNVIYLKGFGNVLVSINESIIISSKKEDEDEYQTFSEFLNKSSVENLYLLFGSEASYNISIVEDPIAVEHRHAVYSQVPDLCEITEISEQVQLILNRLQVQYSPEAVPFKKEFKYSTHSNSNIIISGNVGNGKTYYAKALARHCNVYTIFVSCASLAGDRADTLGLKFKSYAQEAIMNAPSLIIFDDIDSICPFEQEEAMPDINVRVAASTFTELLSTLSFFSTSYERNVNVIVTCKSLDETYDSIQNSKLFEQNFLISVPNREQRRKIFQRFLTNRPDFFSEADEDVFDFSQYSMTEETLDYIVDRTENYSPLDVRNMLDKMVNVKLQTLVEEGKYESLGIDTILTIQEFTKASKDFITQSTEGIKLIKSTTSFSDIGGLQDVKNILRETFIFPTKYASLFENAPIKLRSGLLLYGPPGSGKTFIASAIAKECGLNFISIKGPELLNKYVGASEQAVRDVFMQAESAKPCIIFFDEFDSIAAQRGHDNTGVTDRVVNQFLCQLDGVESRKGVYVLAATSRPDLIDAALLRPGRLDKSVCCNIPTEEERQDIMEVICSKQSNVQIGSDVDFKKLASITHNFTGADLQALFFSATLSAYRDTSQTKEKRQDNLLDEDTNFFTVLSTDKAEAKKGKSTVSNQTVVSDELAQQMKQIQASLTKVKKAKDHTPESNEPVYVKESHFIQALSTSRPSLSQEEIDKYDYIYSCFRGQSSEDYIEKLIAQKKKVTLA